MGLRPFRDRLYRASVCGCLDGDLPVRRAHRELSRGRAFRVRDRGLAHGSEIYIHHGLDPVHDHGRDRDIHGPCRDHDIHVRALTRNQPRVPVCGAWSLPGHGLCPALVQCLEALCAFCSSLSLRPLMAHAL